MSSLSAQRFYDKYKQRHAHRDKDAEINESGIHFKKVGSKIIGTKGDFRSFAYISDSETAAKLAIFTDYTNYVRKSEDLRCL